MSFEENTFPDEIWLNIFDRLNGRDITIISMTSKKLNKLINDNDIVNKIKYKGFPRQEGKCKIHDISGLDVIFTKDITQITNYLYDNDYDLVRGDIIYLGCELRPCNSQYVFCGIKILQLLEYDINITIGKILPKEFIIDNNNIPLHYWLDSEKFCDELNFNNMVNFVWVDHKYIKQNLIKQDDRLIQFKHNDIIYDLRNNQNINDDFILIYIYRIYIYRDTNSLDSYEYYIHEYQEKEENKNQQSSSYCVIL